MLKKFEIKNDLKDSKVVFHGRVIQPPIKGTEARSICILEDRIIVIYHKAGYSFKGLTTANVFAFDKQGSILWEVEPYGPYDELVPFHFISFSESENRLKLYSGAGYMAFLDTRSGKIERIGGRPW